MDASDDPTCLVGLKQRLARRMNGNLDFLAARLHARRSRMADGERLRALEGCGDLPQLVRSLDRRTSTSATTAAGLQADLHRDLGVEWRSWCRHLPRVGVRLVEWLLVRRELEELLESLRSGGASESDAEGGPSKLPVASRSSPSGVSGILDSSWLAFERRFSEGPVRKSLRRCRDAGVEVLSRYRCRLTLEWAWQFRLMALAGDLPALERAWTLPVFQQLTDEYHLRLVIRRYVHHLDPAVLLPFHVPGTRVSGSRFETWLRASDVRSIFDDACGRVIDDDLAAAAGGDTVAEDQVLVRLETLAAERCRRLACRAFRQSHVGLGVVVGFALLQRREIHDLTRISETLRLREVSLRAGGQDA